MMRESDLTAPAVDWLRRRGLEPRLEVSLPVGGRVRAVDCVGWDENRIVAIELKQSLTSKAIQQACECMAGADEAWCAVASATPRLCEDAEAAGVGILHTDRHGNLVIASECQISIVPPSVRHEWRKVLARSHDTETAGEPMQAGQGNRQWSETMLIEFFLAHPDASWRLAYRAVPSTAGKWTELRSRHSRAVYAALGVRKIR